MLVEITKKEYELITKARQAELDLRLKMLQPLNREQLIKHEGSDDYFKCEEVK